MKLIVPSLIALILIVSAVKRKNTYENFIIGAEEGMKIAAGIFPPLVGILSAAYMLRASGAIDMLINFIAPVTDFLHIPKEVMPLAMLRPVSGSGSLGILSELLNTYGADSKIGRTASVIMGSTETTFYCLCVYLANTRAKYTHRVIPCAVIGDVVGILMAVFLIR